VRAGLVPHTHEWPWSSLRYTDMIDPWPVERPVNVEQWINEPLFDHELQRLRECVNRQAPFGTPAWQQPNGHDLWTGIHLAAPRPSSQGGRKVACPLSFIPFLLAVGNPVGDLRTLRADRPSRPIETPVAGVLRYDSGCCASHNSSRLNKEAVPWPKPHNRTSMQSTC
jgi:hypothetical protein